MHSQNNPLALSESATRAELVSEFISANLGVTVTNTFVISNPKIRSNKMGEKTFGGVR